ncbi:MAG: S-layer homology domain-containing protein, partial [Cellulosilyticaceae bacterium]
TPFKDEAKISDFALEAVKGLYEAELMNGMPDGTFGPKASATRAQVAVMLDRMMD